MMLVKIWAVVIIIVMALGIAACGGGGAEVKSQSYATTLGQELKDLEDAYQKGVITEKQYEKSKKN